MRKKEKNIPKFNNIKEEAAFWDAHNLTDYFEGAESVSIVYSPAPKDTAKLTINMNPTLKKEVENYAKYLAVSPDLLIRMWVVEKLHSNGIIKAVKKL